MTVIKKIFLLIILLGNAVISAQVDSSEFKVLKPRELKSFGNNAFRQGDYSAASEYFTRYLKLKSDDYKTIFKLAESHRLNRDYLTALTWYEKAYDQSGKTLATALYYHGLMLKMNGDCVSAKEKFLAFRKQAGKDDLSLALKKQVKADIAGCDSIVPKTPAKILVNHIDTTINKVHVEASPSYVNDSTVLYSALRTNKREFIIEGDTSSIPQRKFYKAVRENGEWKYSGEFDAPFNAPGSNLSSGSFSADGQRFYFSRCAKNWKQEMICGIYVSRLENGSWSEPESLGENVNDPKFTSSQPTVGTTSKGQEIIYFISNRKGGKGGNDIWYSIYDKKKKIYLAPKNAGTKINTPLDELSPFYDQNTATLYFSSSGWPGIGGLDIFKSTGELRKFSVPENLGTPVNSTYDDLFFTISSGREGGMLVSNRKGGVSLKNPTCCDDLYEYRRLEFINIKVRGTLFGGLDSVTKDILKEGTIEVYLIDPKSKEPVFVKSIPVNDQAKFEFVAEPESTYKITGKKDGFLNSSVQISTVGIKETKVIEKDVLITRIPEVFRLENVYYELDKHALTENSKKSLDTTLIPLLNENPEIKIEIGAHTDDQGSDNYNKNLSQKRAEGVVKYLIGKGINPQRLEAAGYGESKPLVPNLNPDGSGNKENRARNRRTEFRVTGKVDIEVIYADEEEKDMSETRE